MFGSRRSVTIEHAIIYYYYYLRGILSRYSHRTKSRIYLWVSVQADALPEALAGHDLLCQSKTGSGKTAVFVLSTLNRMEFSEHIETVVLVPTRELAVQTVAEYEAFAKFSKYCR